MQPLPDDVRQMLDVAAVLGREFPSMRPRGRTSNASLRWDAIVNGLDHAVSLELINETRSGSGQLQLPPCLDLRSALRRLLPAARRRSLHHAVGEAIRALNADHLPFAEVAYHYCRAGSPSDAELAVDCSRQAARIAARQLAYEEAAQHTRNAIDALALKPGATSR